MEAPFPRIVASLSVAFSVSATAFRDLDAAPANTGTNVLRLMVILGLASGFSGLASVVASPPSADVPPSYA